MKPGWTYKKLGEVCEIKGGKRVPQGYKLKTIKTDYPYIRVADFTNNGTIDLSDIHYIDESVYQQIKNYTITDKDIYISIAGTIGKSGIIPSSLNGANLTENACKLVLKESIVQKYVYLFTLSNSFKNQISTATRQTSQPKLALTRLSEIKICFPSLSEQHRIVERLDTAFAQIDELKANAEKQVNEARALFQRALTEAMEPKEGWEKKTLDELATDMYRGSGIKRDQVTDEGIPCVRYGEIYTTYNIGFDKCVSHTKETYISSPKYFEHGDLLFAITGESVEDIGKTIAYLGHKKCLLGGDIICMKHRQDPQFMAYVLSTPDAVRQKGIGKTKLKVVHTNAPALRAISIPLPPLSEQQHIVVRLDALSARVRELEEIQKNVITECDNMKQAILRQVFE